MTRRVRVLHVVLDLEAGGLERLVVDLMQRLDPIAFECQVLALQFAGRNAANLAGVVPVHVAPPMSPASLLWPRGLTQLLRRIEPQIVHTHSGVWYKAARAARLAGVPHVVHTDHGRPSPDPWWDRWLERAASRRSDVVVAVSQPLAAFLAAEVVADPSRLRVILNGVDTSRFCPQENGRALHAELALAPDRSVIGSIGRLDRIKGYDVLLRACAHLRETSDAPFPAVVVAGDGPERGSLEQLVDELHLRNDVFLLGWRDDVHALHDAFTVFTLASHSEGTSVSLLEAMSAGLCPVVTNVGGNAAVLGSNLQHRLVPPADPAALARAWLTAIRDDGQRRADAAAARQRVIAEFSLERMTRAYETLYHELLSGPRSGIGSP